MAELAYLDIRVKSVVAAGTLTIWIDGERGYTRPLSAPGDRKKAPGE